MIKLHRWLEGVIYPHCDSSAISHRHAGKNRSQCKNCHRRFDDLSLSVFSGHHQPLKVWVHCLYLMSLNISNLQIAKLGLHQGDVQKMTEQLRQTVHNKKLKNQLKEEVECDEVYVVAGHKGQPSHAKVAETV